MSFKSPWLLLGLLVLAAAVAVWLSSSSARATPFGTRTSTCWRRSTSGRSWPRSVPAGLLVLGLASLFVGLARPQVARTLVEERATVILVVDSHQALDAGRGRRAPRLGAAPEASTFLDRASRRSSRRAASCCSPAGGWRFADEGPPLVDTAVTDIDQSLRLRGTAIGDALQTAVDLGRPVTDVVPKTTARSLRRPRRLQRARWPRRPPVPEEKSPVSILFLSDSAQTRGLLQPLGASRARA